MPQVAEIWAEQPGRAPTSTAGGLPVWEHGQLARGTAAPWLPRLCRDWAEPQEAVAHCQDLCSRPTAEAECRKFGCSAAAWAPGFEPPIQEILKWQAPARENGYTVRGKN